MGRISGREVPAEGDSEPGRQRGCAGCDEGVLAGEEVRAAGSLGGSPERHPHVHHLCKV